MLKFLQLQYKLKKITDIQLKALIGTKLTEHQYNILVGVSNEF